MTSETEKHLAVLYLDFSKAYNQVCHKTFHKENFLKLLHSYFTSRRQFVQINTARSSLKEVSKGVPQGYVLVLLLFLIFINDLSNCVTHPYYGFADDFKVVMTNQQDLEKKSRRTT